MAVRRWRRGRWMHDGRWMCVMMRGVVGRRPSREAGKGELRLGEMLASCYFQTLEEEDEPRNAHLGTFTSFYFINRKCMINCKHDR